MRLLFAVMIGIGLAMVVFLIMIVALTAIRDAEFMTPSIYGIVGLGCALIVARPSWAIAKRLVPDRD